MSNLEDDSPSFLAKRRPVVPSTSGNADTEADRGASDSVTIVPGPRALQNPPNSSAPVYEDRRDTDMDADDFEILDASNLAAQGLDVDGLLRLVDENPATEEMDETELRQAISRLVKAADTNSKMRAMHEDDPMKFLPSEIELDESLKALGGLVTESVLYDLFIELGGPTLLVDQLHHANLDIGISALTFGCSLIDEGGLSTVDDARMNERAAGWAMVSALTASSFFSEAVTFLLRLDESIPEHAEAAAGVLRCFSSIIAAHGEMAAEMSKTGIVQWLLMRIRYDEVHPYYVNPSTDGEASPASQSPPTFLYPDRCSIPVPRAYQFGLRLFPALRLLAAELLSELLAAPGSLIRAVFLSCGGMKDMLDVLRTYRSQPPKGHADDGLAFSMCSPDETEFAESLFLALATVLSPIDAASAFTSACALCCQEVAREGSTGAEADVLAGKRSDCVGQFIAHSGVELMMEMLRRRVCWGFSALRVMTAAAQGAVAAGQQSLPTLDPPMYSAEAAQEAEKSAGESPTALAQAFIEAEALRGLFPVFMSPRCSKWDADEKTIMGHVITMINFLFTHLHSINFLRVVRKFTEENYTKTARACYFFARMKVRTKHQRKALESGPLVRPTMAMLLAQGVEPDEAISELDAALVSHEAEIMLELMGKGTLPLLQKAALLLGLLVSAGEPLISVKIKNFLLGEGMSLTDIVDVLSAQVMAMSSDTPASTQVEDPGRLSELTIIRNVTAAVNAEIEQALRESRRDPLAGVPGVDDAPVQPPSRPSSAGALGAGSSRNR